MAEETLLSVSLKEYKQEIDSLKTSMLGLERESEQYQKIAKQARDMQEKLNQVLFDAKTAADKDANSMAALKERLRELKAQANQVDIGSEAFKKLSAEILTVNNQLKKAEESMGIFSRNVGDYSNAIIDSFSKMGLNLGGVGKAFTLATSAGKGFTKILDIMKAHPILTVMTLLVGVFMKLKDAIGKNEELSKKWSVAMSAFQPIINAITNAVDLLAGKLVDVMAWVSDNLPKGLKMFGNFAKNVTYLAGNILDVMLFIPKKVVQAYTWMNKKLIDGIKWVIEGIADLLSYIPGMEDIAKSMTAWTERIANGAKDAMDTVNSVMENAGNYVKQIGDSIDGTMNKLAKAQERQMSLTKKQIKLDEDRRKQEVETEKSLLKQQELRNKIAEASGEEKKKLLQQLKNEIEQTGQKELDIAKRTLELERQRRELTPNSREDNLYFEELQKSVIRVEAATSAATVKINKQITSTTETLSKAAQKAAADAEREAAKASVEIVKNVKIATEKVKTDAEKEIADLNSKLKEAEELGTASYEKLIEFEQARNTTIVNSLERQKDIIKEALKNEKLQYAEKQALEIAYQKLIIAGINEETRYRINESKIWLDNRKKVLKEAKDFQEQFSKENQIDFTVDYGKAYIDISTQYLKGKISFEEYQKELTRIQDEEELKRLDNNEKHTRELLDIAEEYANDIRKKFGDNSQEYMEAYDAYVDALYNHNKAVTDYNTTLADQQVDQVNRTKKSVQQQINSYVNLSKSMGSIFGTISEIMEENIKQKVKNGEISEEEAEKEFERVKALQISEAVLSTLSGAVAAFMGTWKDETIQPTWLRAALAATNTAAVVGTGIAQVQKIANTKYGDSSVDGGASTSISATNTGVSVLPLLDENQDMQKLSEIQTANNTQTNSDTRVYIVQSDITDSNKQVEIRQKNTTF